ncbi:MAG: hypothetical protein GZ086_03895 [Gelidibacter sp.]|nr:hypothetical protein [Gelidibacter sp.]
MGTNSPNLQRKGWDGSVKGGKTKITINFSTIGIENDGGPASQVYGYGGPVVYDLCFQFSDCQGQGCDYGGSVCFINLVLCDDDNGAAISFGGNHLYIPEASENLKNQELNVLIVIKPKNEASLNGRTLTLKKDIELSSEISKKLNSEKAFLKAGTYKYNENNAVEVPFKTN